MRDFPEKNIAIPFEELETRIPLPPNARRFRFQTIYHDVHKAWEVGFYPPDWKRAKEVAPFDQSFLAQCVRDRQPFQLRRPAEVDTFETKFLSPEDNYVLFFPFGVFLSARAWLGVALPDVDSALQWRDEWYADTVYKSGDLLLSHCIRSLNAHFDNRRLGEIASEEALLEEGVAFLAAWLHPVAWWLEMEDKPFRSSTYIPYFREAAERVTFVLNVQGERRWKMRFTFTSYFNLHPTHADEMEHCPMGRRRPDWIRETLEATLDGLVARFREGKNHARTIDRISQLITGLGRDQPYPVAYSYPSADPPALSTEATLPNYPPQSAASVENVRGENYFKFSPKDGWSVSFLGNKIYDKKGGKQNGFCMIAYLIATAHYRRMSPKSRKSINANHDLLEKNLHEKLERPDYLDEYSETIGELSEFDYESYFAKEAIKDREVNYLDSYQLQHYAEDGVGTYARKSVKSGKDTVDRKGYYLGLDRITHDSLRTAIEEEALQTAEWAEALAEKIQHETRKMGLLSSSALTRRLKNDVERLLAYRSRVSALHRHVYVKNLKQTNAFIEELERDRGIWISKGEIKSMISKFEEGTLKAAKADDRDSTLFYVEARKSSVQTVRKAIERFIRNLRDRENAPLFAAYLEGTLALNYPSLIGKMFSFNPDALIGTELEHLREIKWTISAPNLNL